MNAHRDITAEERRQAIQPALDATKSAGDHFLVMKLSYLFGVR